MPTRVQADSEMEEGKQDSNVISQEVGQENSKSNDPGNMTSSNIQSSSTYQVNNARDNESASTKKTTQSLTSDKTTNPTQLNILNYSLGFEKPKHDNDAIDAHSPKKTIRNVQSTDESPHLMADQSTKHSASLNVDNKDNLHDNVSKTNKSPEISNENDGDDIDSQSKRISSSSSSSSNEDDSDTSSSAVNSDEITISEEEDDEDDEDDSNSGSSSSESSNDDSVDTQKLFKKNYKINQICGICNAKYTVSQELRTCFVRRCVCCNIPRRLHDFCLPKLFPDMDTDEAMQMNLEQFEKTKGDLYCSRCSEKCFWCNVHHTGKLGLYYNYLHIYYLKMC